MNLVYNGILELLISDVPPNTVDDVETMNTDTVFICLICEVIHVRQDELTAHIQTVHSTVSDDRPAAGAFKCNICDVTHVTNEELTVHIQTVHKTVRVEVRIKFFFPVSFVNLNVT